MDKRGFPLGPSHPKEEPLVLIVFDVLFPKTESHWSRSDRFRNLNAHRSPRTPRRDQQLMTDINLKLFPHIVKSDSR